MCFMAAGVVPLFSCLDLRISGKTCLVVMNSLSDCLFEKYTILPSLLRCGILHSHKKDEIISFAATWMLDAAGGHYLKQINTVTENQIMHFLTYKLELNIGYTWV